jgi:Dr1-associated corepressor
MARTRSQQSAEQVDPHYNPDSSTAYPPQPQRTQAQPPPPPEPTVDPALSVEIKTKFPVARIKRIMQADEDIGKVAQATPTAAAKALELFMTSLVIKSASAARSSSSKRITVNHLKAAIAEDKNFDFLNDLCAEAPDEEKGGAKKGRGKSEEGSEEDAAPKKGRGKKRKGSEESD